MKEGDRIGAYVLEARLGRGFTGATWIGRRVEASEPSTGTAPKERVVLKLLDLREAPGWTGVDLFRREAEALRSLAHPGVPRCLDYFEEGAEGRYLLVLVMEFLEGRTLQALVDSGQRFEDAEVEALLAGLADILAYLGSRRPPVVHRDVNPKNLLLRPDGSLALVDFSGVQDALRQAATPGATLVGTAGYTPLEQVAGRASPRSDRYAAAATALFLLSRRHPADFPSRDLKPDLAVLPELSPRLSAILDSWLDPDEARRNIEPGEAAAILRGSSPPPPKTSPKRRREPIAAQGARELPAALPSDSRIVLEREPGRLRILIPPAGLGGAAGLAGGGFSVAWLAFTAFWTFMAVSMGAPIFFVLFSLPFWSVGVVMLKLFLKPALGSTELLLDRTAGLRFREWIIGAGKTRTWPLTDLGPCTLERAAVRVKGANDRELALEAGASSLRLGRGLSSRELAALRDAINAWASDVAGNRG